MDGRYCLMLKNTYKKGVGIVHGSSNTGRYVHKSIINMLILLFTHINGLSFSLYIRTMYVEPMEVVEPTNEMKSVQGN